MYFPYLYARGSELLALRAILDDHRSLTNLIPLVEGVLSDSKRLVRTIGAYGKKNQAAVILLNPDKHELSDVTARKAWRKEVVTSLNAAPSVLPAWRCSPGVTKANVDAFIALFPGRKVALAYSSPSLSDVEITTLAGYADVQYHVVLDGDLSATKQGLLPTGKRVDVRDRFKKQKKNAAYSGQEFFSDRHSTYKKDKWAGFGDYLCLGNEFSPGGGPAAAVAIHACFKRDTSEVWAEHFVSDDTDPDVGDTGSKFLQAATKLMKAAKARPKQFGSSYALDEFAHYVGANHFPGLGKSKELQISHHLCHSLDVVNGVL
jgi:hypothetical protein